MTSPKQRLLLAVLLVHANRVMSINGLVDALWGERPPPTATGLIHTYVSQLRRSLQPDDPRGLVRTVGPGYQLATAPEAVDATRFEQWAAEGSAALGEGRPGDAADRLRSALALWRGPALADVADEVAVRAEARRLDAARILAVEDRVEAELALGRHCQLVGELETLVEQYPFRERLWGQLLLCLYRAGRQVDALGAYQQLRRHLSDDLGLEPSPPLVRLERDLLVQASSLDWSTPVPLGGPEHAYRPPPVNPRTAPSDRHAGRHRSGLPLALTRFVGRTAEMLDIAEALRTARLLTLTGAGGIGKSRLAVEAAYEPRGLAHPRRESARHRASVPASRRRDGPA